MLSSSVLTVCATVIRAVTSFIPGVGGTLLPITTKCALEREALTRERARVSEGPDLGISQSYEPHDEGVQQIFVIDGSVLTLLNQLLNKFHKGNLEPSRPLLDDCQTYDSFCTLNFL